MHTQCLSYHHLLEGGREMISYIYHIYIYIYILLTTRTHVDIPTILFCTHGGRRADRSQHGGRRRNYYRRGGRTLDAGPQWGAAIRGLECRFDRQSGSGRWLRRGLDAYIDIVTVLVAIDQL